jgi:putative two-component system response regulator
MRSLERLPAAAARPESSHDPERVLVVDDEGPNVRALERILRAAHVAEVRSTSDPTRVVPLCAEFRPDLILLDLHMPARDGFEVLADLAAQRCDACRVPVVVLTGDGSEDAKLRALSLGAKDFLTKPFGPQEVVLRVRNLLETRALYRALATQNTLLEQRVWERTRELDEAQLEVLERLAVAAELRDDETGRHTQRVGDMAGRLASALGRSVDDVALIRRAATLHDVGKIGIPDDILRKPGRLTPQELDVMKTHTLVGARILSGGRSALVTMAERIARSHHERWDGTGYPDRLAGEQIPLEARIVAVADVYDALTSDRPYRPAWARDRVLAEIAQGEGTHFDPQIVRAFLGLVAESEDRPRARSDGAVHDGTA